MTKLKLAWTKALGDARRAEGMAREAWDAAREDERLARMRVTAPLWEAHVRDLRNHRDVPLDTVPSGIVMKWFKHIEGCECNATLLPEPMGLCLTQEIDGYRFTIPVED